MSDATGPTALESLVERGPKALLDLIQSEIAEATAEMPELVLQQSEAQERHQAAFDELCAFRAARASLQRALEGSGEGVSKLIEIEQERLAAVMKAQGAFLSKVQSRVAAAKNRLTTAEQAHRQFRLMTWSRDVIQS
ncbi:MAG TPA: hypothetical protein VFC38_05665 [Stellaceae bacterium]|nr:hypothetical protein [Stellaceae bacterium]